MNQPRTIITASLTGSQGTKEKNHHTPITPDEIIEDALLCGKAGAAIVHIHVKADDGITGEIDYDKFKYIREGIAKQSDLIINFSTSGEVNLGPDVEYMGTPDLAQTKRLGILETMPEMGSFDVPTMNFEERIFMNPLPFLRELGKGMQERSILPEVEIYSVADIYQAELLIQEGALPSNPYYQFCLGIRGGTPPSVKNLLHLQESLPKGANWSAFGIGVAHLPIMYATLALGGHLRVGLEDNLYYRRGQLTSNVELIERAVRVIEEFGNRVATPNEAREMLGIK